MNFLASFFVQAKKEEDKRNTAVSAFEKPVSRFQTLVGFTHGYAYCCYTNPWFIHNLPFTFAQNHFILSILLVATLFPPTVEKFIGLFAGALIFMAQIILLKDVVKRNISPSLLSWIGWALLMGTSLVAQTLAKGWQWSLMGLMLSTFGCVVIFTAALVLNNYLIKKADWYFLMLGLVCLAIYLSSKNAWLTTAFAILADLIVGIPTIHNGFKNPASQKTSAWLLALVSWSFSLLICIGHNLIYALFPIYLFGFNGLMFCLTHRKTNI